MKNYCDGGKICCCPCCGYHIHQDACPYCGYCIDPCCGQYHNIPSEFLSTRPEWNFSYIDPKGKFQMRELVVLPSGQKGQILGFHIRWVESEVGGPSCWRPGWWSVKAVTKYEGGSTPERIVAHDDGILDKLHTSLPREWDTGCYINLPCCPMMIPRFRRESDCHKIYCPYGENKPWNPKVSSRFVPGEKDFYHVALNNEVEIPYKGHMVLAVQYNCTSGGPYYEIIGIMSKTGCHYRLDHGIPVSKVIPLKYEQVNEAKKLAEAAGCHGYMYYWGEE